MAYVGRIHNLKNLKDLTNRSFTQVLQEMRRLRSDPKNFEQVRPMGSEVLAWLKVECPPRGGPREQSLSCFKKKRVRPHARRLSSSLTIVWPRRSLSKSGRWGSRCWIGFRCFSEAGLGS